ncbi:PepSY domain-containing protein [Henriciella sp.]|uniref:PepSY-associated TM helix domain-containing protein n=1 Tax=Henriciella sp. TaxID=1968823 RepID=UPI00261B4BE7|nr:PepSY-associated TM helix domain-containing protein [Henriciella sp.]
MASILPSNPWLFLHRWLGILMAVFLFLAAVTGSLLTVRESLDHWVNADLFEYGGDASARLESIEAVSLFQADNPELQVTEFPLNPKPAQNIPVKVMAKPGTESVAYDEVFLDPATGARVGERSTDPGLSGRQIIPLILGFHEKLLLGDAGRIFLGFIAIGWLVSSIIGLYLTFPKRGPFFAKWRAAWTYSPKRSFARQMLDIHRASGLWLFAFVVILAFTSVALNFFFEFWAPLAETIAPLEKSLFDQPIPYPEGAVPDLSFEEALALAQAQVAEAGVSWQPATMLYDPDWNLYGVTLTDNGVLNYKALGPIYYHFDAATGAYVHEVNPYNDSAGLAMMRAVYPLHSGEIGGGFTVFIIFLTGLATAEMCVTGLWVWLKKRGPRIAARKKKQAALRSADRQS